MPPEEDTLSSLEKARQKLYTPRTDSQDDGMLIKESRYSLPHVWKETILPRTLVGGKRHIRIASIFFFTALSFFLVSLIGAGLIFVMGSNSVSVDKIAVSISGPSSIAGGDTVPLTVTITNRNTVAVNDASVDIGFPPGTRDPENVLKSYPRYFEELGTLGSGETITRTVKAVIFGQANETLNLPVAVSYGASGSNAVFVKKATYGLLVSTTPLSVTAEARTESVSGQSFPITLTVTSNASVPLANVLVAAALPYGYTVTNTSIPLSNGTFAVGTLAPGASKKIVITGTLAGQTNDERAFHFTVGTAAAAGDDVIAVTYMTLDVPVSIAAPFIATTLSIDGDTSAGVTLSPGTEHSVSLSYTNTLSTSVSNAVVSVKLSGSGVDYGSIETTNGFYRSSDRTIVFSRDTDPSLATIGPGASGVGTFSFKTVPVAGGTSPTITFTTSVAGTRTGQSNVPEEVTASSVKTAKVATNVTLTAESLHSFGPMVSTGPTPPTSGQATTYAIVWSVRNSGSPIADGTVTALLPSYVSYTGLTSGTGAFSYDAGARTVTWQVGEIGQGSTAQGAFQVSFMPSDSQRGNTPTLVQRASFSGFDRFAGIQVTATSDPVTTETKGDPGYVPEHAVVQ